ncbi:hypothetical protein VFPPC_15610 [Pochonia chlamydosporia 170]|uniref:Uncharacterized protein n=1 Tax=Pochonia chlamydosporia 170 TaxID=1380566 RepID=A0A179G084_METCM|nr:hypothetical protein VFPPC_15610 [Pochonia chlamydosporia 170]OAQ70703.1 hypothetical protein VFPPC_15610 [Pochonia chlamydosporia 170]
MVKPVHHLHHHCLVKQKQEPFLASAKHRTETSPWSVLLFGPEGRQRQQQRQTSGLHMTCFFMLPVGRPSLIAWYVGIAGKTTFNIRYASFLASHKSSRSSVVPGFEPRYT